METNKPLQFASVLERIKTYQTKLAAESSSVEDPTDKGTVGIPKDPENTDAKKNLPASAENTGNLEGKNLEDKQLKPVSTGKNVPGTQDGNKKEEVSSPTDSLSKIAGRVASVTARLKAAGAVKVDDVKDPTEKKKAPMPKADKVEVVDESAENKDAQGKGKTCSADEKLAANDSVASDISAEALMKLASTIISTEGGMAAVEPILMKAAGIEAARQIMAQATESYTHFVSAQEQYEEQIKQAAEAESLRQAQAEKDAEYVQELLKSASEEDKEQITKFASIHGEALGNIEEDFLKAAYVQGAEDAAAMEDAGAAAPPPEGGDPAAAGAEAGLPGAEGPASLEQIAQLLEAMVQGGEIDEQTAIGILQELAQAEQGGGDPAAAGGDPAAAGGDPAAEAAAAEAAAEGGGDPAAEAAEKGASTSFQKSSALCSKLLATLNK